MDTMEIVKIVVPLGDLNGLYDKDTGNFKICTVCGSRVFYTVPYRALIETDKIRYVATQKIDYYCAECGAGPYTLQIQLNGTTLLQFKNRQEYLEYIAKSGEATNLIEEETEED